jgi:hypothetical protein
MEGWQYKRICTRQGNEWAIVWLMSKLEHGALLPAGRLPRAYGRLESWRFQVQKMTLALCRSSFGMDTKARTPQGYIMAVYSCPLNIHGNGAGA